MNQKVLDLYSRFLLVESALCGVASMIALLTVQEKIPQNFLPEGFDWQDFNCTGFRGNSSAGNSSSVSPQTMDKFRIGVDVISCIGLVLPLACILIVLIGRKWQINNAQTISTLHFAFLSGACLLFGVCLGLPLLISQKLITDVCVGKMTNTTGFESLDAISISSIATWAVLTVLSFIGMRVLASKQNKTPAIFVKPDEKTRLLSKDGKLSRTYGFEV